MVPQTPNKFRKAKKQKNPVKSQIPSIWRISWKIFIRNLLGQQMKYFNFWTFFLCFDAVCGKETLKCLKLSFELWGEALWEGRKPQILQTIVILWLDSFVSRLKLSTVKAQQLLCPAAYHWSENVFEVREKGVFVPTWNSKSTAEPKCQVQSFESGNFSKQIT